MRQGYPVKVLCEALEASESSYYARKSRQPGKREREEAILEVEIMASHKRNRGTYGAERIQGDLRDHGTEVGVSRIKRIRKKLGIKCKQVKKFKVTTDSKHDLPVADNVLGQNFEAVRPNQVWVTDITYIPTEEGWLYLAGHKDIYSNEIVGYAFSSRINRELVSESLYRAVAAKRPPKGLIHHSDRGSQYCATRYRKLLEQFGMITSMSRKGNCYDNAPMESFWGLLKTELVHHRKYRTREEAIREITEHIEIFYNRQRKQAQLGYLSPAAYERQFYKGLLVA
jgi:transposase InsO family protein